MRVRGLGFCFKGLSGGLWLESAQLLRCPGVLKGRRLNIRPIARVPVRDDLCPWQQDHFHVLYRERGNNRERGRWEGEREREGEGEKEGGRERARERQCGKEGGREGGVEEGGREEGRKGGRTIKVRMGEALTFCSDLLSSTRFGRRDWSFV